MTENIPATENLDRAMILESVEFEAVKQGRLLVVVIGINEYVHWKKLNNAVQDAIGLQQTFIDKLGFAAPIPPLLNEAATKEAIESLIEDRLREELQEDDNLVLFFAGHGHTRTDKVGGKDVETGFIIPVEARFIVPVEAREPQEYWSDYIQIDPLLQSISKLPARHILVIIDSCYSGFALGEAMKGFRDAVRYEKDLSSRISRKVITSARKKQLARDSGPLPGHSLFTGILIDGFNSETADLDGSGWITSSELGLFIQQKVGKASESNQTPDFGSFYLDDRGEMVISLRNQSFDALKARAFSALQRGDYTTFKELVREIVNLKPSSPEALYLQYRLMIVEGDFQKAILLINQLLEIDLERAAIPLSKYDLTATLLQIKENLNLLELQEESNFPLKIELLTGSHKDTLAKVKEERIDKNNIYSVESQNFGQLKIENLAEVTLYVYAIKIDSDGRVTAGRLWENQGVSLNGLQPQETELSYTFVFNDRLGICERYLLSSRIKISHLSETQFLPNVAPPEINGDNLDLINLKNQVVKQVIRYQILPPSSEICSGNTIKPNSIAI